MTETGHRPRLRILMRSHGAENRKNRPSFYDKTACLASLIRAAQEVTPAPELLFVNDGVIPAHREQMMSSAGEVLQGDFGSNRASYLASLSLAANRQPEVDLVWFAEDDYLYTPQAFAHLLEAAQRLPDVDYFSLYLGELAERPPRPEHTGVRVGSGDAAAEPPRWIPAISTTSSFAVRQRQLVEDLALLRLMPYTGGAFDHTTSLTLQGRFPFTLRELGEDLFPFREHAARDWPRHLSRGAVRTTLGLRSLRRPSRRRRLYQPDRDLITHLEMGAFDPTEDWRGLARRSVNACSPDLSAPSGSSRDQSGKPSIA